MYVATWLDNYDEDFGCYRVFKSKSACESYLAAMVMFRAKNLAVPVIDLTRTVRGKDGKLRHPRLRMDGVLDLIKRTGEFELAFRMDYDGLAAVDKVTVAVRETDCYD